MTGCTGVPAVQVANLRMNRTRFRAGRSYGTIIAWWASRAADHHPGYDGAKSPAPIRTASAPTFKTTSTLSTRLPGFTPK